MESIVPQTTPKDKPHYVYTLSYPESMGGYVFYIGKGYGRRITEHEQRVRKGTPRQGDNAYKDGTIRKIWNAGEEVVRTKLAYFATNDEAIEYEAALIFFMKGYEHLTNLSDGGEGTGRVNLSEEAREKLRKSSTGRFHSEETRRRMSESAKKRGFTEEHRRKISESLRGKTASDETKRKMSESQKIAHSSPEYRYGQSERMKKRGESEEYRQKQREYAQKQWESRDRRVSEDTRRNMIDAQQRRWEKQRAQQVSNDFYVYQMPLIFEN